MATNVETTIDVVGLRERLSKVKYDGLKEEATKLGVPEAWKGGANKQTIVENIIKAYVEKSGSENSQKETGSQSEEIKEPSLEEQIPEGEYDIDEETLEEFPGLVERGFKVGDVLIVKPGGVFEKGGDENPDNIVVTDPEVLKVGPEDPAFGTEGIVSTKTIEEADAEIKEANGGVEYNEVLKPSEEDINKELKELNGGSVESIDVAAPVTNPVDQNKSEEVQEEKGDEEVVEEYVPEVIDESLFTEEEIEENILICESNCKQALPETRIFLLRKIDALKLALERKQK